MIDHKNIMYWVSKEDYIKIIDFNLCCSEEKIQKLYHNFLIKKDLFEKLPNPSKKFSWYRETDHGKLHCEIIDLINELDEICDKAIILERTNINNINFEYKSEEMKIFMNYIEYGGTEVIMNVAEE